MFVLTLAGKTEVLSDDQKETAMERYWQARSQGDPTATITRCPDVPTTLLSPEDDAPDDPPAATPTGVVSEIARLRIEKQDAWLRAAGFALAPPLFAPGTRVRPLGDENFQIERRKVERMPPFPEAAQAVIAEVTAEQRQDLIVDLPNVSMDAQGRLQVQADALGLEAEAFAQLALLGGFGMGLRYLSERCSAELRALNVNRQLAQLADRPATLRTRQGPDGRQVYAVVTPTYTPCDTHQVLAAVQEALADARTDLYYDGTGVRGYALWMPDQVLDLAAGDVFKVGVRIETDDTGRGRIRIAGVVWRNRCLNLLVIGRGEVETLALVHRGDPDRLLALLRSGVDKARAAVAHFLDAWGHARTVPVQPEETIRGWVETGRVGVPGTRTPSQRDAVVAAILTAWHQEPGETLADAVNAVSRAAHEHPTWGMNIREELERQASQLVLVPR